MNDIEFCSVGCISTGRELFARTTETLRWKWFYLRFFSPQSRGSLLPNYMSSCQPESAHTYKHRLHAIPWFLNKMQWQYKSVEIYFFYTTDISNKNLIFEVESCTKICYFLPYVSIYIIFFIFLSIYKQGPKSTVATNFIPRFISHLDFAVLTVFTSPFQVQVECRTPFRSK